MQISRFTKMAQKLASLIFAAAISISCFNAAAEDWPQWQGPNRNAISAEKGLLQQWPENGPLLAWRVKGLGGGDSAPAVFGGKLYGMSNRDGKEIVWALSEADGTEVWTTELGDAFEQRRPQSKEGPGCTPTIDGDRLYVEGMGGRVACLQVDSGEIIWQKKMVEDFGGVVPTWSYRESPLVDGDRMIITPGGSAGTIVALNKMNGETLWATIVEKEQAGTAQDDKSTRRGPGRRGFNRGPSSDAAYASPIVVEIEGIRQYVQMTASSLIGVAASDGRLLWKYSRPANAMGINCSTPIYQDGLIFAASAYGAGGGAVKLTKKDDGKFEAEEVYFTTRMQNHHGGTIVVDGALYGANGGNGGGMLACLNFQTGEVFWIDRDAPKGALAFADGRLYLRDEEGPLLLIEPSKDRFIERGRFEQPDRSSSPAWAHPVIANGKLYIRDQDLLLCYDIQAN